VTLLSGEIYVRYTKSHRFHSPFCGSWISHQEYIVSIFLYDPYLSGLYINKKFMQFTHFANLKLTFWWFDSHGQRRNWEYADI